MAKISGEQDIPSEHYANYIKALGLAQDDGRTGKRFPFRLPFMKSGGSHVTQKQEKQRERFNTAKDLFAGVDTETRERWYEAAPPWGSFLWYYDYFIMSALVGNADQQHGGVGVIKSIQFKTISIPAGTGEGEVAISEVDPAKTVVMLFGNSLAIDDESGVFFVSTVYPYVSSIAAELLKCKWSLPTPYSTNTKAATIGATIIEYI